jgi:hypothetical protein
MTIARAVREVDPWLAAAAATYKKEKTWWRHGFARMEDHCREVFHRSGRWLRDLASLGSAFKQQERLEAAFSGSDGGTPLGRCRATLIARVATPLTLRTWIILARRCTVDELRKHVRIARDTGSGPPGIPPEPPDSPQGSTDPPPGPPASGQDRRLVDDEEPDTDERCRLTLQVPFPVAVAFDEGLELFRAVEGSDSSVTAFIEALVGERAASGAPGMPNMPDGRGASGTDEPGGIGESDSTGDSDEMRTTGTASNNSAAPASRSVPRMAAILPGLDRSPASTLHRAHREPVGADPDDSSSGHPGPDGAPPARPGDEGAAAPASLPRLGDEPSSLDRAEWALARFEAVRGSLGTGAKADPADQIEAMVRIEEDLERRLGEVLLGIGELRGWRRLGFTGAGQYAEQRLGVSRSWAEDRIRAARSLRRFPRLRHSYEEGVIGMEAVLRVSAILKSAPNPDAVIDAWVERAAECTVKRLRDESRELMRRRVGLLEDRFRKTAAEERAPLDDLSWFRSLARRAGTARRRLSDLRAMAVARPMPDTSLVLRLPDEVADAFVGALRSVQPRAAAACRTFSTGSPTPDAGPTCRTFSTTFHGPACEEPLRASAAAIQNEPGPASTAASAPAEGPPHQPPAPAWAALLVLLEDFVEEWDKDDNDPRRPAYLTETAIAFGWRCSAPGCTSRQMLQVHHLVYRSRGGGEEMSNLILLCAYHHLRGEHGDLAACRGRAPLGVTWRLGKKPGGRHYRNERRVTRGIPQSM